MARVITHLSLSRAKGQGLRRLAAAVGAAALGCLLLAPAASAQRRPPPPNQDRPEASERAAPALSDARLLRPGALVFASFDTDVDFAVSRAEAEAGLARAFSAIDVDGDGVISLIAYGAWAEKALGDTYARPNGPGLDRDLNGEVTAEEFTDAFMGLLVGYGVNDGPVAFKDLTSEPNRRPSPRENEADDGLERLPQRPGGR